MEPLILTKAQKAALLTAMTATGGILESTKVILFQNDYQPTEDTVLADLTVATYTGYAAATTGTWGAVQELPTGQLRRTAQHSQFNPTGTATTNTIFGYGLTNSAGDTLIGALRFDEPKPMTNALDAIIVEPIVQL